MTLTWEQVREQTGYSDDDLQALTASWIGEPGYLTDDGHPTQASGMGCVRASSWRSQWIAEESSR